MKIKYVLVPLLVLGLLTIMILIFGGVSGEKFSAQRFTRRRFSYYQLPLLRIQLSPVTFSQTWGVERELTTHLKSVDLLGDVGDETVRWDIVFINEVGGDGNHGDAEILTKYFEHWGAVGGSTWLAWTKQRENMRIAATLWPLVAKLAHANLYILIPDLFDAARSTTEPSVFLEQVKPKLIASINKLEEVENTKEEKTDQARITSLQELAAELANMQPLEVPERMIQEMENVKDKQGNAAVTAEAEPESIP